jgi:hypothetical protein
VGLITQRSTWPSKPANELDLPVVVFFGLHPAYPNSNLRHYSFLVDGLAETQRRIRDRGCAFVLRPHPDHDLIRFCSEVSASLVIGDENPMRGPERWRFERRREVERPVLDGRCRCRCPIESISARGICGPNSSPETHASAASISSSSGKSGSPTTLAAIAKAREQSRAQEGNPPGT